MKQILGNGCLYSGYGIILGLVVSLSWILISNITLPGIPYDIRGLIIGTTMLFGFGGFWLGIFKGTKNE